MKKFLPAVFLIMIIFFANGNTIFAKAMSYQEKQNIIDQIQQKLVDILNQVIKLQTENIAALKNFRKYYKCNVNWECSDWSVCANGQQTRTCTDLNNCGTKTGQPPITQTCSTPTQTNLILGAFNASAGTMRAYFNGWTDIPSCAPSGQTTFIYWENYGYSLDSIINGSQDANINKFAGRLCPNTILAPLHEMNGNWDPWDGTVGNNTPAKIISAWKRIHDIIGNKAKWAWVVNNSDEPDRTGNRPSDYYPGDNYVDIIGVDGFNWGGLIFTQAINPNYNVVKDWGKPVWITSFGTGQTNQGAWITDAIKQAKANGIGALIYFSYPADGINFTLNANGLAAFQL